MNGRRTVYIQTVLTVVCVWSDPGRALTDEMPRLRRLIATDRSPVTRPFHPGVGRRLQIGTADHCIRTDHTSTAVYDILGGITPPWVVYWPVI